MATFSLTRGLSSGVRLIFQGALNQRKPTQCYQRLRSMSALAHFPFQRSDPYAAIQEDLNDMFHQIKTELTSPDGNLNEIIKFYFDGENKYVPATVILMAKMLNNHVHGYESILLPKQREVAMIAEMLNIGAGCHGLTSISEGSKQLSDIFSLDDGKSILVGDYILSLAVLLLSRIGNFEVYAGMCKILGDQVQGEFKQCKGPMNEDSDERLSHFLKTSFLKMGSLLANSCKGVAIFAGAAPDVQELAFEYGKNVGITLQLINDASIRSSQSTIDDLHSASKPMINAPETNYDTENATLWARQHCADVILLLQALKDSPEKQELLSITNGFLKVL